MYANVTTKLLKMLL